MTAIKAFLKVILYKPLFNGLILLVWLLPGDNVGWAIVILTMAIRLILLIPSAQAIRSQKQLQELQPEIEKIREEYKDDQKKQAEKTMEFYRQNKINPFGSCLPMLIQMPFLIILYYVFRSGLDTNHFYLLYSSTPRPEGLNTYFLGTNLAISSIYFAVVAGILQFVQTKMLTPKTAANKNKTNNTNGATDQIQKVFTNQFVYLMPFFTIFIAMTLPAALSLYWIITSLFSIIQQAWIFKFNKNNPPQISVSIRTKNE